MPTPGLVSVGPRVHPFAEVLVATTWQCNLACTYCFVREHGLTRRGDRMTRDTARRLVDSLDETLDDVEVICLHLYGGEPLTNLPALQTLVDRARQKQSGRFRFAITTNGCNLSDDAFDALQAGEFDVILSLDGPAPVHDECRRTAGGRPTHATVIRFLENLRARTDCRVRGSAVVRSGWRLAEASAYLGALPFDAIKAQAIRVPSGAPYDLSPAEKRQYLRDLEGIGDRVIAELQSGHAPKDDRFSSRVLQLLHGSARESFCGAGATIFGVTPDGTVLPCVLIQSGANRLGHISDERASWREAGRAWRAARPLRARCRKCEALPLCGGGCPAMQPYCGDDECVLVRKNCQVARKIFAHFASDPAKLLPLAGIN